MFEIIGIGVVVFLGWVILKVVLQHVFPKHGLQVAERRYQKDPSDENERLVWKARSRVPKDERPW